MAKTTSKKTTARTTTAKKAPAKRSTTKGPSAPGSNSKFAGRKLTPTAAAKKENPRRPDSHGHRSLEIIRKKPGITYEAFIAAGGRACDLRYDVAKGHCAVS
jgi:hypothetical protein